ncbi:VCBS domain-containing protein [Bradyrhizobium sp. CCBAU 53415]|uniref:VCBS domain-containing protein n=1 Tax=Bradyrhizobium sp. CCBAU 53415 TaxID=1325119 RepID=UPI003FA4BD47
MATSGGNVIEKVGTGNEALDTITGTVTFTDVDLTDRPIVSAELSSTQPFKYLDAEGNDITATLTPAQLAAIAAVKVPLSVVQGAGNGNNGSATWTYSVPDHLFDFLAEDEKLILNYVVQVDDGHGGIVSTPLTVSINGADVNVEGTNDVPTIIEDDTTSTGAVTEDAAAPLVANGTITFNDPDLTDTHTASFELKSTNSSAHLPGFSDGTSHIGTFALTAVSESPGVSSRGSVGWTFTIDNNDPVLQSLAEGQTVTQVYTVTVDDHHGGTVTRDVTVTITGTNDAPTITSDLDAATGGVTEDAGATLSIGGTLAIQDLDLIDTHTAQAMFKSSTSSAHLPGFDDDTPLGTFTIDSSVLESIADINNGAMLGWHFTLGNSNAMLQSLAEGQTITQVYTVTFDDHHGGIVSQDVTVTITGVNDAPTITSDVDAAKGAVTEDEGSPLLTCGTLAIQDVDLIDTHTAEWSFKSSCVSTDLPGFGDGSHIGTFSIGSVSESNADTSNGATLDWHFCLDNSNAVLQSLAEGQTITQVYTVTFDDHHGGKVSQDVTVTITGTNDAPTLADLDIGPLTDTVAADTFANLTGQLSGTDVDSGETATLSYAVLDADHHAVTTVAGLYGSLTVNPDGSYSYIPDATAIDALPEGCYTDTFAVQTKDAHGATGTATLTVDVTGANDTTSAPVINLDQISVSQEGDQVFVHGITVSDADAAVDETFTLAATADSGTYVDPASTSDTLANLNSALQTLTYTDPSQSTAETDKVVITVTDGHGASDTVNLIFNLNEQGPVSLASTNGKDVLFGTGYQDQFVFAANSNHDTILDFEHGQDHINLTAVVATDIDAAWIAQHVAASGADTLITINATDTILLKGVAQVQASDFIVHA